MYMKTQTRKAKELLPVIVDKRWTFFSSSMSSSELLKVSNLAGGGFCRRTTAATADAEADVTVKGGTGGDMIWKRVDE